MDDSIFTKIIRGEVPSHKIYEDEHIYAFLDINPSTEGHTLVVPKQQVEFVWDLADKEYAALMASVKKIAAHLRAKTGKYVGEMVLGTDVPHAHVHLIPFTSADEVRPGIPDEPDHDALAQVATRLKLTD